jgi:hypothetical protein
VNFGYIESLKSAINNLAQSAVDDIRISIPGKIVSYDSSKNTASVKFCVGRKMIGGQTVPLPTIENVPILFTGNDQVEIIFKPEAGDEVLIYFSDVDVSGWVYREREGDPESIRKFNINDCFAVVVKTKTRQLTLASDEILSITAGDGKMSIKTNGSVMINNHLEVKV